MHYQALARKWRPQFFKDIIGQDYIISILVNSLILNKIHHAYLLSGYHGVGKTTIARLLAKCLNCKIGVTSNPCGRCKSCIEIQYNKFIDLLEVDAASRTKVEDTRDLLDNVLYKPFYGRFKVYLIDEIHMLSLHSFNALLKTLEEPPSYTKFILVTTNLRKIPPTIISRCLQLHFKMLTINQIYKKLKFIFKQENIKIESKAIILLSKLANGSMRDALSISDQVIVLRKNKKITYLDISKVFGVIHYSYYLELVELLFKFNVFLLLKKIRKYELYDIDWDYLLSEILSIFYSIFLEQIIPDYIQKDLDKDSRYRIKILSQKISLKDIQLYYQIILVGRKNLLYAPNKRIGVEMTLLKILSLLS